MKLKEIKTGSSVTVTESTPIWQAALTMEQNGCGFLPIVRNGKPVGVVTGRDLVTRIVARRLNFDSVPVSAIMSSPAITAGEEVEAEEATLLMRERNIHRLVVTGKDGAISGVIALSDLAGNTSDDSIAKTLRRHAERSPVGPSSEYVLSIPGLYTG